MFLLYIMKANVNLLLRALLCIICINYSIHANRPGVSKAERLNLIKGSSRAVYVLRNNIRHKVPNSKTLHHLEEELGSVIELPDEAVKAIPEGGPFPSWEPKQKISKKRHSSFILKDLHLSDSMINPSITKWRNQFIACFRVSGNSIDSQNAFQHTVDRIACQILNNKFEILGEKQFVRINVTDYPFLVGEDPRIHVSPNQELFLTFNKINITESPYRRMLIARLEFIYKNEDGNTPRYIAIEPRILNFDHESESFPRDQKNWTPFTYSCSDSKSQRVVSSSKSLSPTTESHDFHYLTLFVYSIFPQHRVIHAPSQSGAVSAYAQKILRAETVATTIIKNFTWNFGDIRGGTPPILVPLQSNTSQLYPSLLPPDKSEHVYLSFFHSSRRGYSSTWWATTYFVGAYIFSPEPPFRVLAISDHPVIGRPFYQGKWASSHTDYVPFPSTAFLLEEGTLGVAMGLHDREGWVFTLDLGGLLRSLVAVTSQQLGIPRWETFRTCTYI